MDNPDSLQRPKLRPLDFRPMSYEGSRYLHLRDPLEISQKSILVPEPFIPVLPLLDGKHTLLQVQIAISNHYHYKISITHIQELVRSLDEALLLENPRYQEARAMLLNAYQAASYRNSILGNETHNEEELLSELVSLTESHPLPSTLSLQRPIRGMISPHIDFGRGGPVYARTWAAARQAAQSAELVILLGTDHFSEGHAFTLTRQNYSTPCGVLPTDQETVSDLANLIGHHAAFAGEIHHRTEHSLEFAATWLHLARNGQPVNLLPILCGPLESFEDASRGPRSSKELSKVLEYLQLRIQSRPTLVVAAGDLSHVGPAFGGEPVTPQMLDRLKVDDELIIKQITSGHADGFYQSIRQPDDPNNICGLSPIYLALRILEPTRGTLIDYAACPADTEHTSYVSIAGILLH